MIYMSQPHDVGSILTPTKFSPRVNPLYNRRVFGSYVNYTRAIIPNYWRNLNGSVEYILHKRVYVCFCMNGIARFFSDDLHRE